ncbi:hypothetical protein HXX76_014068 [Chlamydomonas incerta]|uniref:Uncharacterized protein n=1 Tax=Chlamydomonas incerta TaxID=51695 RepID=A0A835SQU7_CHLIN|nr:hypothetical protein HXX76_014068 [Chlamydomonas incerta]|eukprot:KAG2424910.1 hypothetical protein HXX76_014068 [Chlamydomonas incerta]
MLQQPAQLLRPELDSVPLDALNYALLKEATARQNDPRFVGAHDRWVQQDQKGFYSALSGRHMEAFDHGNMLPYYSNKRGGPDVSGGGAGDAAGRAGLNERMLENYTGHNPGRVPKQEIQSLYEQREDFVNGMPSTTEFMHERQVASAMRNGTLPFQQQRVGPGVGLGSQDGPSGGYHQFEIQEIARPKTVDEMRTADRPKVSYTVPVVQGQMGSERGQLPVLQPLREACEADPADMLPNTGPAFKPAMYGVQTPAATSRGTGDGGYVPPASSNQRGLVDRSGYSGGLTRREDAAPNRNPFMNPNITQYGQYDRDRMLSAINLPPTRKDACINRSVTDSVLTGPFKALLSPVMSVLNSSRKALLMMAGRDFSNLAPQVPGKLPMPPTDRPRTTVKETLLHDAQPANMAPRAYRGPIMDTSQPARTTIKETLIHDGMTGQLGNLPRAGPVYDPNQVARTTGRETLAAVDYTRNLHGTRKGALPHQTPARTTVKETTLRTGPLGAAQAQGPQRMKLFARIMARLTNRTTTSSDHYGPMQEQRGPAAGGFRPSMTPPPTTKKEITSLYEYLGAAEAATKAQPDGTAIQNMRTNDQRELVTAGRENGPQGAKTALGAEAITLTRAPPQTVDPPPPLYEKMPTQALGAEDLGPNTKDRAQVLVTDRLDPGLLSALRTNPYVISPHVQRRPDTDAPASASADRKHLELKETQRLLDIRERVRQDATEVLRACAGPAATNDTLQRELAALRSAYEAVSPEKARNMSFDMLDILGCWMLEAARELYLRVEVFHRSNRKNLNPNIRAILVTSFFGVFSKAFGGAPVSDEDSGDTQEDSTEEEEAEEVPEAMEAETEDGQHSRADSTRDGSESGDLEVTSSSSSEA